MRSFSSPGAADAGIESVNTSDRHSLSFIPLYITRVKPNISRFSLHPSTITMKLSLATSLTLTLLAGLAAARDCSAGYNYCGSTLNRIGTQLLSNDSWDVLDY
jgi:hypothetical protein